MTQKKNFDSDFCGSLPLHHINSIQDYGYLLVLDISNLKIIQTSENIAGLLGKEPDGIVNTSLSEYLEQNYLSRINQLIQKGTTRIPMSITFKNSVNTDTFSTIIHLKTDQVIIELEKADEKLNSSFADVYQNIKYISAAIDQATTVQEVCDIAVHELRKISGFDGVLMYKFDEEWNGTVLSEDKDERLSPYIGQTFPASDIPKQARQLYLKNPYRLIPNRGYQPLRLYPVINPLTNVFTDLSDCNLRGVAAVHLEYMKNMGIKASMSIRVLYNESLWGLISCHHIEEKYLDFEVCSTFEWLSDVISNKIALIINKEKYKTGEHLQQERIALTDLIYAEDNLVSGLLNNPDLNVMTLFKASGAVVVLNGRTDHIGQIPARDELENLLLWLEGKNLNKIFSTSHVAGLYDEAAAYAGLVSGLLFIPVDDHKGDFVVCFRPEVIEDIQWGGDPHQAINFEKDGKAYHPRNSFELWKQTVSMYSLGWTSQELEVAESLRSFLFEFRTKQLER